MIFPLHLMGSWPELLDSMDVGVIDSCCFLLLVKLGTFMKLEKKIMVARDKMMKTFLFINDLPRYIPFGTSVFVN